MKKINAKTAASLCFLAGQTGDSVTTPAAIVLTAKEGKLN